MSGRNIPDSRSDTRREPVSRQPARTGGLWTLGEVLPELIARYGVADFGKPTESRERTAPQGPERTGWRCA